ncbi:efflux transporter outer membrane subunit [Glacieibacterium frigidum]|uniref:TolC family protein n=1 Tax=Glacieibacterium frigidum TaxID=2593303 RepID=A0A552U7H4_9SPHN|nr:TolC family protein [Glacieibacterium frigidum]TRW14129.1 TolC family protein [Glacieibacterium frigidum]
MKRLIPLAAALALSACSVGPEYRPAPIAPAAAGQFDAAKRPVFDQDDAPAVWWRLYNDPVLDALIQKAFAANTDIRVATANLRRARAVLREARGSRLPTTDTSASGQYRRFGGPSGASAAGQAGAGGGVFESETYSAGLDVDYEIDLFGRVGRLIAAARADAEALAAVRDTVRITVAAETARAYADACSSARQLAVARGSLDVQTRSFDLTERLYAAGRGTPLDTARARAQLETVRATLPTFVANRQEALYRLAVLTGDAPSQIAPEAAACIAPPLLSRPLPVGDGAELIKRRPDIREADRRLAAEIARIGVATADLYPRISIGASVSTSALSLGGLGKSPSIAFGIGPLLSWSFPNFAVVRARIAQAQASAEGALATFDDTLLNALQETETALADYAGERDRNAALLNARDLNREAVRIVRLRYGAGATSFIDVLDAERSLSNADASLAESDALLTTRQIAVFKALGGGWEGLPEPVAPPKLK